jgi:outer membrane biosynthesis protein TonB
VTLYLSVFVNERGGVDDVEVDEKDLHPSFAEAAMRAFSLAEFKPGRLNDRAVKSLMRIEVVFEPVDWGTVGK